MSSEHFIFRFSVAAPLWRSLLCWSPPRSECTHFHRLPASFWGCIIPFCRGQMQKQENWAEEISSGEGWSFWPLFAAPWRAGTWLRVSPAAAITTWCLWRPGPDAAWEGIFQIVLEQLALHDDSCNLQVLRDLPEVKEKLCDGGTKKKTTPNLPGEAFHWFYWDIPSLSLVLVFFPCSTPSSSLISKCLAVQP